MRTFILVFVAVFVAFSVYHPQNCVAQNCRPQFREGELPVGYIADPCTGWSFPNIETGDQPFTALAFDSEGGLYQLDKVHLIMWVTSHWIMLDLSWFCHGHHLHRFGFGNVECQIQQLVDISPVYFFRPGCETDCRADSVVFRLECDAEPFLGAGTIEGNVASNVHLFGGSMRHLSLNYTAILLYEYAVFGGACCLPDGSCEVVTDANDCIALNGTYREGLDCRGDECPPACEADIDNDGAVTVFDLLRVLECWGPWNESCENANIEFAGASIAQIDVFDLLKVLSSWGSCS